MKVPQSGGYFWEPGGLKTSVSVPVHLWSSCVGQFCQHVVAVCRHSSASLGTTALSSLHSRPVDVSGLLFLWTDTQSDNVGSQNKMRAAKNRNNADACAQVHPSKRKFNSAENINKLLTLARVGTHNRGRHLWWAAKRPNSIHPFLLIFWKCCV